MAFTGAVSEVIASHAAVGLELSDHGLDRNTRLNSRLICGVTRRFWLVV
jgi:hypothetical protein